MIQSGKVILVSAASLTDHVFIYFSAIIGFRVELLENVCFFNACLFKIMEPDAGQFLHTKFHNHMTVTGMGIRRSLTRTCITLRGKAEFVYILSAILTQVINVRNPRNATCHPYPPFTVRAVRSGTCFETAVHRVKALQIQLAHGNPGESADEAGKVAGFGLSFNIVPPQDGHPGAMTRQPHPYNGDTDGPYYAPEDAARAVGHGINCRQKFGGLNSCAQVAGVTLNSRELDGASKNRHMRMLNALQFDRFTFTVTLVNEMENEAINRRSLEKMVGRFRGHPVERIKVCQADIWFCGRCFCSKPLLRSLDEFGRV